MVNQNFKNLVESKHMTKQFWENSEKFDDCSLLLNVALVKELL